MTVAPSDTELDAMRLAAGEDDNEPETASEIPRCPACGHALDDVSKMTDEQVLKALQGEMYRDLLRNVRRGMATHQELAIARGILRDNDIKAKKADERSKGRGRRASPYANEEYDFTPGQLDETEGG